MLGDTLLKFLPTTNDSYALYRIRLIWPFERTIRSGKSIKRVPLLSSALRFSIGLSGDSVCVYYALVLTSITRENKMIANRVRARKSRRNPNKKSDTLGICVFSRVYNSRKGDQRPRMILLFSLACNTLSKSSNTRIMLVSYFPVHAVVYACIRTYIVEKSTTSREKRVGRT